MITLISNPDAISAAYSFSGIIFQVSSDDGDIENMQVLIEKFTTVWETVATIEQPLDLGSTTTFTIDIKTFLESQVTFDLPTIDSGTEEAAPDSEVMYRTTFTERLLSGGVISDGATLQTTDFLAINAGLQYLDVQSLDKFDLDGSVLGTEIIVNGDFATGTDWVLDSCDNTMLISSDRAEFGNLVVGETSCLSQTLQVTLKTDKIYLISYDVNIGIFGDCDLDIELDAENLRHIFLPASTVETQTLTIIPSSVKSSITFTFTATFIAVANTGFIDNISIKELNNACFLTDTPNSKWIREGESEFLRVAAFESTDKLLVTTFDKTGVELQEANIDFSATTDVADIPVGYSNLNSATLSLGTQPLIDENVDKYEVKIITKDDTAMTETKTFRIDRNCYKDTVRFHFQNRLGGMDSFTAIGEFEERQKTTSRTYEKNLSKGFSIGDRGREELSPEAIKTFAVNTGWLKRDAARWLFELLTSPQVYIEIDNKYVPVIIDRKSADRISNQKNIQRFTISYSYANDEVIQHN